MKASIFALAAAGAQFAAAHTTVYNILVNGKDAGLGNKQGGYIDSPPNNDPVKDVTSKAMECNVANIKASSSVSVNGGDEITVQWHHDNDSPSDDIIASSHKGPISVYVSKAGSSYSWVKIAEDGYSGGQWAVDKLLANKGKHSFVLPKLVPGDYVIRPEIIALHEGNNVGGAQFYQECVHVKVGGAGTAALPAGVAIPGYLKATDPGVHFDIYSGNNAGYVVPGPKVWNGASSGGAAPVATNKPAAPASTTKAAVPVVTKPAVTKPAAPVATKTTMATVAKPAPTAGGATAQKWGQCGGIGYTGATACAAGSTCAKQNDYYSQCL